MSSFRALLRLAEYYRAKRLNKHWESCLANNTLDLQFWNQLYEYTSIQYSKNAGPQNKQATIFYSHFCCLDHANWPLDQIQCGVHDPNSSVPSSSDYYDPVDYQPQVDVDLPLNEHRTVERKRSKQKVSLAQVISEYSNAFIVVY